MQNENFINDKFTIDELFRRSWNHRKSEAFIKFFNFIARFHHYSRFNTMLIYSQNECVTFFGGVSFWEKKFNRKVKANARPYVILAPMSPVMLVYDIMETEGADSPEVFLEKGLGEKLFEVKGSINPKTLDYAIYTAESYGIPVRHKPLSYFKAGHVTTIRKGYLEICLKEDMGIEQNLTILLHELAHLFLGHTEHMEIVQNSTNKRITLPMRGDLPQTLEELEAETVSYLISKKLGLETRSAEYLSGYIKSPDDLLRFSYETVIKVADKIEKLFIKEFPKRKSDEESINPLLF